MSGADPLPSPPSRPVAVANILEGHLEHILGSQAFSAAEGLRRLLSFVVHESLAGRGGDLKEYSLGATVLGKGESFDPKADPIVRVQMRRLREHLARYYATEGRGEPLVIEIPKGTYAPSFRTALAAGTPAASRVADAPIAVGHEHELAALRSAFRAAETGAGRLFCVAGEPGIGKTTLVERFLRELRMEQADCYIARGRCSERLIGSEAYLPVFELLETLIRTNGEPVQRLMANAAPTWYAQVAPANGGFETDSRATDHRLASQERLKLEMVALLQALARERTAVLFVDDLHWADPYTVDLLTYALTRCASHRVLIAGTFRPAELMAERHPFLRAKLELQAHDVCREISLPLLTAGDVDRYLALQCPAHAFPPELAARIHRRTEGNPLFIADLTRFLRDRGVLAHRDGQWTMAGHVADVEADLPESVRSMVQKKIAELTPDDRGLMAAAAVLGHEFDSAVVARTLAMDPAEVEERLENLDAAHAFVRQVEARELPDATLSVRYAFVHVLYQEALQAALAPTRRASLSAAAAESLAASYGNRAGELAAALALLYESGRNFAKASDFFLLASHNAARVYAAEQAIELAQRAISNAQKLEGTERHERVILAALQSALQQQNLTHFAEAIADCGVADQAAAALGDPAVQIDVLFYEALILFLAKRIPELKVLGTRAAQLSASAGSPAASAKASVIHAMERLCAGDVGVAGEALDTSIPVLHQNGAVRAAVPAVLLRGLLHTWRLEHAGGDRDLEWAQEQAAELHTSFELLISMWHQARARGNQGRLSEAWSMLEEGTRLAELLGDRFWLPRIENTKGWLLAEVFDTEGALRLDVEAVRVARQFGDVEAECNGHINAARDYLVLGEPARALEHLQQAQSRYEVDNWFRWVYFPRLQGEMASYWIARGDVAQARGCAQLSLDHATRTTSRKRMAWAHTLLGEIAMLDDRPGDARDEYASALRILERHACPTIEWQILVKAAEAASALDGDAARRALLDRARIVVRTLADSIDRPGLRQKLLGAREVRELFAR
jgi:tetratricopeptide (TPR) repeat protein